MEWSIIAKREKFTLWNGLLSLRGRIHTMEWSIIAKRENSLYGMVYYGQEGEFTPWNGLLSL
jgi:hypothetical protein